MKSISRRDTLKLMALGTVAGVGLTPSEVSAKTYKDIKKKIVILGAGLAGITLAARLKKDIPNSDIILVDGDDKFYYQPGFTLVAIGFYTKDDVIFDKSELIPEGVEWIKQNVKSINPSDNLVLLDSAKISYDYLVIATGVEYEYEAVEGLSRDDISSNSSNIASIYTVDGAIKMQKMIQEFSKNGGNAIFADQKTPMKCSGANKKMVCMSEDFLRRAGNRDKGNIHLYCGGKTLFSDPTYAAAMVQIFIARDIKYTLQHQIIAIDKNRGIATFEHTMPYKDNGEIKVAKDYVDVKFDFFHLPPKQRGFKFLKDAGLTVDEDNLNWLAVDKKTLQSTKYDNIFGIGDIINAPKGKTGASVRKMYPTVVKNIISHIKGEALNAKYDGYTACPFITKKGKAIMVEFDWEGIAPTAPKFGATRESYLSWLVKLYVFKPMIMKGMMRGLV